MEVITQPTVEYWEPILNPTQGKAYNSAARFVLVSGGKGCRPIDTQIYLADRLARLGTLMPAGSAAGEFSQTSIPLWSFDGREKTTALADAYWVEPDKKSITAELSHGGELTGSDRHPIWVCADDGKTTKFDYYKLSEIDSLKKAGWRFWTPLVSHPKWSSNDYHTIKILVPRTSCRVCGKKTAARGFCHNHYNRIKNREAFTKYTEFDVVLNESLAYALGAIAGDGSIGNLDSCASFTNTDQECISAVSCGLAFAASRLVRYKDPTAFSISPLNNIRQVLRAIGLGGTSYHKRIPDKIISSPKSVVASFLSGLFDTDGTVDKAGNVQLCTTSEKLSLDVQDVLMAFGMLCIRRPKKSASGRPTWTLSLHGRHAVRFGVEIGFKIKRKQSRIGSARISLRCPHGFNQNRYGYPPSVSRLIKAVVASRRGSLGGKVWKRIRGRFKCYKSVPSPEKLRDFCNHIGCENLFSSYTVSDNWVEVVSLSESESDLADLRVLGTASFLASGTINHNSGKTNVGLHALVRHCFDEENALALIIAPAKRTGKIGVVGDLESVLDIWRNGNKDKDGNRIDEGMGLEYTAPFNDPQTKDTTIEITNRHGGVSTIILISIPHPSLVARRMKAMSPSFVYFDEITETEGEEYFTYVALQLGRRKDIVGPQQFYASCNPEGPSHWVWKVWFQNCIDDDGNRSPDFEVYHIPISENRHNLPPDYYERQVIPILKDEIDRRRLVDGEWVDRPSGDGIFKDYFRPDIHVRPTLGSDEHRNGGRLVPHRTFPIWIGYDPGPTNYSIVFLQMVPTKQKVIWIVFDELIYVGENRPDFYIASELVGKMDYWSTRTSGSCQFVHVADQSAFSHRRNDGNYDATRMKSLTDGRVIMRPFASLETDSKGSVPARIQMIRNLFLNDGLIISATCIKTREAISLLTSEKPKVGKYDDMAGLKPKRSPYLHPFDALSYPIFYTQLSPAMVAVQSEPSETGFFRAGRG